jgi:hypothetical protein
MFEKENHFGKEKGRICLLSRDLEVDIYYEVKRRLI